MNRFLGAVLLVSGMAIGTGMLALPVITSFAGFFPSFFVMVICWFFMLMTGFMVVDVSLTFPQETNFISMAERTLGSVAKKLIWVAYLLLFYAVNAAHILGSIPLFSFFLPFSYSSLLLVALTIGFVYYGTKATDLLNRFVIVGLFISYGILIFFLPSQVVSERILHVDYKLLFLIIPVLLISFGYQNIVPSLVTYLQRDGRKTKWALTLGTFIPLLIYAFWEFLVIGTVPLKGTVSLAHAYLKGEPATIPLMSLFRTPLISMGSSGFTFFTIVASYIGISLGLVDFLIDGLKLHRSRHKRLVGCLLAFFPPLLFVYIYPQGFFLALQYAGVIAALVVGILPTLMAWKISGNSFWKERKGKSLLLLVFVFFLFVIVLDILFKVKDFSYLLESYLSSTR